MISSSCFTFLSICQSHIYNLQPAKANLTKNSTKLSSMKAIAIFLFVAIAAPQWTMVPTQGVRPDVFECDRVAMVVRQCYTYLKAIDSNPSISCCNGAKMIMNLASKPDEQPLGCKCYKEAYSYFDNIKENAMLELSKECNLNMVPLNDDTCSRH